MSETIGGLLRSAAERFGDTEAVVDGDTILTFRQLAYEAERFARAAHAHGLRPGDRVAVWAPNSARWLVAALGTLTLGGTVVTVNTRYRGAEAADLIRRSSAQALFVQQGFLGYDHLGALRKAAAEETGDGAVPRLCVNTADAASGAEGLLPFEDFLAVGEAGKAGEAGEWSAPDIDPDSTSHIIFTSGTTGTPKGVLLNHRALLRLYTDYSGIWGIREGDRYLVPLPFFHTGGQSAVLSCLIRGATILPLAVFDPTAVLETVERLRVSVLIGAPTIFAALLDHPERDRYDLSSLRLAATGAAVVPVRLVERCHAELPFENFITAYGLTECHGTATMCRAADPAATVAATNGRAVPGVEVRVVGPDGADAPAGTSGEVWVRGYHVTRGYLDDPAATAEAVDADGWLHTGDIGNLDADGNLAITDRLKDLFIVGGFNVSPAEVEQVMARHPAVSEVAVIGVPDERLGEVGHAYVIPRPGTAADPDEITAWCRERLANFKVPSGIVVTDTLPRNTTGKVQKTELRALYRATGGLDAE
ncbi:AMP-binding protein [Yinghuangia seranimata]|uniref:AMP-binding protein n=1 Tax=Yinghuangia seranimata TaxID=408067 RepID=UPI00248AA428|nr:AMP-binding protein [Yinghuangia seranimata]MDI2125353.1 AMP-binding protein [Yinghuangia seranimata]